MTTVTSRWCNNLRIKCFLIGYMNLIASIVDIACHIAIVAIVSNGFQCDVDEDSLASIDWPWLEPFLLVINLGTHGFYPFPLILRNRNNVFIDYMPMSSQPKCYPGMLHVYLVDILNLMINVIWLKFVKAYVVALHRKDPEPMRMFFGLSVVKLVLQIMYFSYQPEFRYVSTIEAYWFVKLFDIVLAAIFLIIIHQYIKQLRQEKTRPVEDQPPPYIECLINGPAGQTKEQKEVKNDTEVAMPEEQKPKEEAPVVKV
ncbi:uncharacterized protein LOC135081599 [Ostrinia nubilalis]|uniref:uncharacterized protein LOC135081599 n=1 Tax=Ostrinia nubilalis TaxID=29057 RepID=UPI00308242AF